MIFIQLCIIAPTSPKINPDFQKIFPGTPLPRRRCGTGCQGEIFAQRKGWLAKSLSPKKLEIRRLLSKGFYVNSTAVSTAQSSCGKPLWIILWRMWKTPSYQQVFCLFASLPFLWKNGASGFHNTGQIPPKAAVTSPSETGASGANDSRKVQIMGKNAVKVWLVPRMLPNNLCISYKIPGCIIWPPLEILVVYPFSSGGVSCRGK